MNEQEINTKPVGFRILRGFSVGLGLLLLNLIFVLGPYVGVWGITVGFITSGFAFVVSGLTLMSTYLFTLPFAMTVPSVFVEHPIMMVLSGGLFIGSGGLLLSSFIWIAKYLVIGTGKYVKWQVKLVRGDNDE